jgi:methionine--tRNA ligase beta chain
MTFGKQHFGFAENLKTNLTDKPMVKNMSTESTDIPFTEFQKLDLRIGKITEAAQIPGSRNLIKMVVDFGSEKRQAVAGLLKWYKPEDLVGKKGAFILNLQHRVMMGVESQCMIFAAEDGNGNVVVLQPEKDIAEGSRIH